MMTEQCIDKKHGTAASTPSYYTLEEEQVMGHILKNINT